MGRKSKNGEWGPKIDLREIELEVLEEGREWMKRRVEEKLATANAFSPGGKGATPECPEKAVDGENDCGGD